MKEYLFFQNHKKYLPKEKSITTPNPSESQKSVESMGKTGVDFRQLFY